MPNMIVTLKPDPKLSDILPKESVRAKGQYETWLEKGIGIAQISINACPTVRSRLGIGYETSYLPRDASIHTPYRHNWCSG